MKHEKLLQEEKNKYEEIIKKMKADNELYLEEARNIYNKKVQKLLEKIKKLENDAETMPQKWQEKISIINQEIKRASEELQEIQAKNEQMILQYEKGIILQEEIKMKTKEFEILLEEIMKAEIMLAEQKVFITELSNQNQDYLKMIKSQKTTINLDQYKQTFLIVQSLENQLNELKRKIKEKSQRYDTLKILVNQYEDNFRGIVEIFQKIKQS